MEQISTSNNLTDNLRKTVNITVKETSEIMGMSQQFVRLGLQRGILPFGYAIKMSSKWTYHISKNKLFEYLGVN
jgi:hypothetical protein